MTKSVFSLIFFALVLDNLAWGMIIPIAPSYSIQFGASNQDIGLLYAVYMFVVLALTLPLGILSDRYGRKPFIVGGLLSLAVSSAGYAVADSMTLLLIARCFQGLAGAMTYSAVFAMVAETCVPGQRGKQLGLVSTASGVGLICGPIVGGILAQFLGPSLPFALVAGVCALLVMPCQLWLAESRERTSQQELGIRTVLTNRQIVIVSLLTVFGSMMWSIVEAIYPKYLTDTYGYEAGTIGALLGIALAAFTLTRAIAGKVSDRRGRKPVFLVGLLVVAVAGAFVPFAESLAAIAVLLVLVFVGFGWGFAAIVPLVADTITAQGIRGNPQGTGSAVCNLAWASGFALGPLLGGILVTGLGLATLFGSYAVLIGLSTVVAWFFLKEPFRRSGA